MNAKRSVVFALSLFLAANLHAATRNNDDSCDISTLPAATLLLPYFEVDLDYMASETTLFTITNVTSADRIARVTLWTDYAFPIVAFNLYLTGYDVQAINLLDVLQRGVIAPDAGTGTAVTKRGAFSDPNHDIDLTGCARVPGALDPLFVQRMRAAFTTGRLPACREAGAEHDNAVGYATVDVVRTCSTHLPTEREYWTEDIAFENVLTGDYQQINSLENYAQSNTMVHIRAVPEGGTPGERRARPQDYDAGFSRTFYNRYQAANEPRFDGRQPLPSTFAARWIQHGTNQFQTSFKIWREGLTDGRSCENARKETELTSVESVVFDEAETAVGSLRSGLFPPAVPDWLIPPVVKASISDAHFFPQLTNGAVGGWLYLNLDRCGAVLSGCEDAAASQNWVVVSMRAGGRYSSDADAISLGNGCSPPAILTEATGGPAVVGPAPNVNP